MSSPRDAATLVAPDQVLEFDHGIPGFPDARRFALRDLDEAGTFQVLESVDDPALSIVVCPPWLVVPDYEADLPDTDRSELDLEDAADAALFCAVTVDEEQRAFHLNLLGPFVVNTRTRRGRQVVLADSGHPARHTVYLDAAEA